MMCLLFLHPPLRHAQQRVHAVCISSQKVISSLVIIS
ncbi:hypothetical protein MUK42_10197 [Musa troglodytarum]|uniref:Uncharacterized protein n=1 Tax=Musa troglodytarum TaxID=320322 RepID=A0A9E7EU30_9LILI|nr:hypothetical protein MUK42_10197 [Musa troglodytarum]